MKQTVEIFEDGGKISCIAFSSLFVSCLEFEVVGVNICFEVAFLVDVVGASLAFVFAQLLFLLNHSRAIVSQEKQEKNNMKKMNESNLRYNVIVV